MNDNISKISLIMRVVLIAIAVIVAIFFYLDLASVEDEALIPDNWVNRFLKYSYILAIGAAILTVGFALLGLGMKFIDSPKKALIGIIPAIILLIVVLVGHSMASDVALDMPNYEGTDNVTGHFNLKWSGTGLYVSYFLIFGAIAAILYAEVSKLLK